MRWVVGLVVLLAVSTGAAYLAAPHLLVTSAAGRGITVTGARWCPGPAMCLDGLARPGLEVEGVTARLDGSVHANTVKVTAGGDTTSSTAGAGSSDADTRDALDVDARIRDALGPAASWIEHIDVEALDVRVGQVTLPTLRGRAWPDTDLQGDGLRVQGDTVSGSVQTPWGPAEAEARPEGSGLAVTVRCAPCAAPAGTLDDAVVPLPDVVFTGTVAPVERSARGQVRLGQVSVDVEVARKEGVFVGSFTLPATPLSDAYAVLAARVPEVARARIGGTVAATGRARWTETDGLVVEEIVPTLTDPTVSGLVPDTLRHGTYTHAAPSATGPVVRTIGEGTPDWVPLAEIGPHLPAAVVAAEDGAFWSHPGYALSGMLDAFRVNAESGRIRRGGSTMTQQLAKNLFLDGERSYVRKLRELLYALDMERSLGKSRILELYLNMVELGPGIYGAGPAARAYFVKRPTGLLPEEAAFLAGILNSPRTAWKTQYLTDQPATGRVQWVLKNMANLDDETRAAALARPIRFVPP